MSLARIGLLSLMIGGLALPAAGRAVVPAADKALWCASAFNWLARDADDAADAATAEILDAWSLLFTRRATAALRLAGYAPAAIEAAIAASDQAVLDEMASRQMRYDIETCSQLETS